VKIRIRATFAQSLDQDALQSAGGRRSEGWENFIWNRCNPLNIPNSDEHFFCIYFARGGLGFTGGGLGFA
jgi:hypothetical protein